MKKVIKDGELFYVISLREAIQLEGTTAQIKNFLETGKIATNPLKSILRRFEEKYEKVSVEGRGANRNVILTGKRDKPIKLDKRTGNPSPKPHTVPFVNEFDYLIIKCLRDLPDKSIDTSMNNVLLMAGLISPKLAEYRQPNRIDKYVKEFDTPKQWIREVFEKEYEVFKKQFLSSLVRLEKKKLISWSKRKMGVFKKFEPVIGTMSNAPIVDENGNAVGYNDEYKRLLTVEEENRIAEIQRELMSKHKVTTFELIYYEYKPNVRAFNKERKELYMEMGLKYHYTSYAIQLTAPDEEVENILETNEWMLEEVFTKKAALYSFDKAEKRQLRNGDKNKNDDNSKHAFGEKYVAELPLIKKSYAKGEYPHKFKEVYKNAIVQPDRKYIVEEL